MPLPNGLTRSGDLPDDSGPGQRKQEIAVGKRTAVLSRRIKFQVEGKFAGLIETDDPAVAARQFGAAAGANVENHHAWLTPLGNTRLYPMRRKIILAHAYLQPAFLITTF
jgi:hypothetical protein